MKNLSLRGLFYSRKSNREENEHRVAAPDFFKGPAFSPEGFIERQSALTVLRTAARTADYCGCGWIAVWNLFRTLGTVLDIPSLIEKLERGMLVSGILGTDPFFIRRFLRRSGLSVSLHLKAEKFLKSGCENGILFYLRPDFSAHYVAFSAAPEGAPRFLFHNTDAGPVTEELPAFLDKTPHRLALFFAVKKNG